MKFTKYILTVFSLALISHISLANGDIPAFYKITNLNSEMDDAVTDVVMVLEDNGFSILGQYTPANNKDFYVITFTSTELQRVTLKIEDRGALASILKVGFQKREEGIDISILNPEYLFYGYLRESVDLYETELASVTSKLKGALNKLGSEWVPFGGAMTVKDLKKYHYMMGMPYFDDPVKLKEFSSFGLGVETIRKNLGEGKGNTIKVYEVIFRKEQIAIFGVGLLDPEKGEGHFLPIIGEDHIAAMPYEIIVQGNQATMLHGRFRYALHWPELTMGTFTKIMSTPGYVKDTMKDLME